MGAFASIPYDQRFVRAAIEEPSVQLCAIVRMECHMVFHVAELIVWFFSIRTVYQFIGIQKIFYVDEGHISDR